MLTKLTACFLTSLHIEVYWWIASSGYQEEDIDPEDIQTLQLVIGDTVLDENGIVKKDHKYVFAPDGNSPVFRYLKNMFNFSGPKKGW